MEMVLGEADKGIVARRSREKFPQNAVQYSNAVDDQREPRATTSSDFEVWLEVTSNAIEQDF